MTSILNPRHLHPLKVEEADHDYHISATTDVSPASCAHCQSRRIIKHTSYEVPIREITRIERPDGVIELFTTGSTGPADRNSKERDAETTKLAQFVDQFLGAAGGPQNHGEPTVLAP